MTKWQIKYNVINNKLINCLNALVFYDSLGKMTNALSLGKLS